MDIHQEMAKKWRSIISEAGKSNLSARAWCREHCISVDQFYYWRKKLSEDCQGPHLPNVAAGHTGIAQVNLVLRQEQETSAHSLAQPQVMIKIDDFQVYVGASFDDDVLRRVLGVVKVC